MPQIFHVAVEFLSLPLNHFFCSAPRSVCGGAFPLRVGDMRIVEPDLGRGLAAVECATGVENSHPRLGKHSDVLFTAEFPERGIAEGVRASIAVLVGDDQIEVPSVPQRAVGLEAVDRRQVVRFQPQSIAVEFFDGHVFDSGWIEAFQQTAPSGDTCRDVFEPRLIRRDLDGLAGLLEPPRLDDALPALPREFVVVPDHDERPARASVLEVGIFEIAFVDGTVAIEGQRYVEIADLVAVRYARNLKDRAVVARLHLFGILDDLVDEITEVQDEIELLSGGSAFIFVDHPAKCVGRALIDILTAHECEVHRTGIFWQRRCDRAADSAAISGGVGKPIPVSARRLESANQNARRPVRSARDRCVRPRNDPLECLILGYLDDQELACALGERTPRPQDDAVRVGIAGGDPLRIEITPLTPAHTRS